MKRIIGTSVPLRSLRSGAPGLIDEPHGTFATALPFIDWLAATGQGAWQMLPITETQLETGSATVHVPSPYKGYGVGVDPQYLFGMPAEEPGEGDLEAFRRSQSEWLPDYALFCAIRDQEGTDQWNAWPAGLRDRLPEDIESWSQAHADDILRHEILQWRAHRAFDAIRSRAKASDILIIGDLPFYLSIASPLVWAHRAGFDLSVDGRPRRVTGVPDSPKAHFGRQLWGHPLYDWSGPASSRAAMDVWKIRLSHHAALYDLMRLDHAKGFFRYGSIDPEDPAHDAILPGPGSAALEEVILHARAAGLELFAEDSGDWLDALRATLRKLDVPGIRILRFAYNEKRKAVEDEYADIARYPENSVAYTTTHDTVTLMGYVRLLDEAERRLLCGRIGIAYDPSDEGLAARLRGALLSSPSRVRMVAIQDWLLTGERINVPGTEKPVGDENWRYRMAVPIESLPARLP